MGRREGEKRREKGGVREGGEQGGNESCSYPLILKTNRQPPRVVEPELAFYCLVEGVLLVSLPTQTLSHPRHTPRALNARGGDE